MKLRNGTYHLILSAIADFKRNKIRTALTSMGIMIGVLSVVMLIALGLGLKNYIKGQFESMGANLVMVLPGSGFGGGEGGGGFSGAGLVGGASFDERDVSTLKRLSDVEYVVPVFFKSTLVESGTEDTYSYIEGMNEEGFKLMNIKVLEGELWGRSELQARSKVVVLGYSAAENLFDDPKKAVGRTVRFENQRFKVIGVAEKKGDREQDNSVMIPYTTTFGSMNPGKTFWSIYLGVLNDEVVSKVKKNAEDTLLKRYKDEDFSLTEQAELLNTFNQIFGIINMVLVAIGSISLVVGGIGIMNIMYASVTERTKEVGIRRAVGATQGDIMAQFLAESVVLSVFGGALGLILAAIIVLVVRIWFPVALNLLAVVIAFGVSSAIGVFFGVFPARRAAKLPPITAIRYE